MRLVAFRAPIQIGHTVMDFAERRLFDVTLATEIRDRLGEQMRIWRIVSPMTREAVSEIDRSVIPSRMQALLGVAAIAQANLDRDGRRVAHIVALVALAIAHRRMDRNRYRGRGRRSLALGERLDHPPEIR